jgi:hypothetical protein
MCLCVYGPPVEDFNLQPYVKIWLRNHRSADSAPRGKEQKKTINEEDELKKQFFVYLFK